MSQADLIWGAFSLMLLGALVSMCMKCQRAENKRKTSLDSQRNRCAAADYTTPAMRERHSAQAQRHPHPLRYEGQQRAEGVHSYSMPRQQHLKMPCAMPEPRKSPEDLSVVGHSEARAAPRYQHFEKEMQTEQDPAYVEPIHANHHNGRKCLRTASDEDFPYQNVAGPSGSNACVLVNADVYENSPIIQLWKNSQIAENLSSDDEPDYINANINSRFPA